MKEGEEHSYGFEYEIMREITFPTYAHLSCKGAASSSEATEGQGSRNERPVMTLVCHNLDLNDVLGAF